MILTLNEQSQIIQERLYFEERGRKNFRNHKKGERMEEKQGEENTPEKSCKKVSSPTPTPLREGDMNTR
jgi:hypothetical protein